MPALFYHVTQSPIEVVVTNLLTRALGQGWRVELRGQDPARMDWFDQKLWLGAEEDFLPHGMAGGPHDDLQPVLLTTAPQSQGRQAVMTLEGAPVTPEEVAALERVWILFDGRSEPAVQVARDQWRALTGAGVQAQYWAEEDGRWQKKAEK
ncbi:DNA polymerase III chi subunit [Rhodobacter aestuarii]|uniref:DNA polymerase III, chi subunit n=1 Tax=Rhodobacter aestuarii TaxID=453582 RepID=A0A1N7M6Y3_9RHOB|nr:MULTISPECIES: DNA polymerase III subunit chi [Rhodobacter]PTV94882.1 DNA polymerase III chi subunit [Rhodobacter aestuarii]SIS81731.1 DNA polymerase III, chi subunit [Rhodobacter aestuarii]SOC13982.1 DNA polymerase III chi subunit [Rhodobacter sp. JA431]